MICFGNSPPRFNDAIFFKICFYEEAMEKVFVSQNNTAAIKCPSCNQVKSVNVAKFKGKQHVLKAKCGCGNVFDVRLDFRKNYRKAVRLSCNMKSMTQSSSWAGGTVLNVSKGGVGLTTPIAASIKAGDKFLLKFTLDDKNSTIIEAQVVIKLVEDKYLGCEFIKLGMHDMEKALGFYLMP